MVPLKRIHSGFDITKNFLTYNFIRAFSKKPFLPRALCIYVTYRCNLRCKICGIWRSKIDDSSKELKVEELGEIFSDPLFSKLEFVNINGGEPNLRTDLVEIVELIIKKFPRLKTLTLNSNGIPPEKTIENANIISSLCAKNKIKFSVSLSLHQTGEKLDGISGVKDTYIQVNKAFDGLKGLDQNNKFYIAANCVLSNLNLLRIEDMLKWSRDESVPINFTLGEVRERFNNLDMADNIIINEKDKDYLIESLRNLSKSKRRFLQHALKYSHLADMLQFNMERKLSCHYMIGGFILGSEGSLFYCKSSKAIGNCRNKGAHTIYFDPANLIYRENELVRNKCLYCPPNTFNKMEVGKDLLKIIKYFFLDR